MNGYKLKDSKFVLNLIYYYQILITPVFLASVLYKIISGENIDYGILKGFLISCIILQSVSFLLTFYYYILKRKLLNNNEEEVSDSKE